MAVYDNRMNNINNHKGLSINPWLIRVPILFITGMVLLLLILVIMIGAFRLTYLDRITPGVVAFGVDLGGMTRDEAIAALDAQFVYDDEAVFTFLYGDQTWQMTAGELGVSFDSTSAVDEALHMSSGDNVVQGLVDQAKTWVNGYSVSPAIIYDQNVAIEKLAGIASSVEKTPVDATLVLNGVNVVTTPGQAGYTLDIMASLQGLNNVLLSFTTGGQVQLVVNEIQPRIWNADEAANKIHAAFSGALILSADGVNGEQLGPWTADISQIAALITLDLVDSADGTLHYDVGVDMNAFSDFLDTLAPGLIVFPQNGRFHFNETTGQLEVIQPAIEGRELNIPETLARLEQAVFRYDARTVPMAFNYTQPIYHNAVTAAELGITQMVSESTTFYSGSTANRRHNIALGASLFDGVIIGPGEEFSFNYWLGDVSLEAGFAEGKVIVGGRTVGGVGGGICQVSTTAFRAAFTGGFTIIERNSHAYRVGYYELNSAPGLDAAIWTPDRDFRFQNDTPYHLLIETSIYPANNSLQFRFYSTDVGRVVEIQQPVIRNVEPAPAAAYEVNNDLQPGQSLQVDYAAEGADVQVTRIIRDANGNELRTDHIFTHYLPWQAVFEVPPGDPRLSQTGGSS